MNIKKIVLCLLMLNSHHVVEASSEWSGTLLSNHDLNTATNWTPIGVPGASGLAVFDNLYELGTLDFSPATTPGSGFVIGTFTFPHTATLFTFTIPEGMLEFTEAGMTGTSTDATFVLSNNSNATALDYQLYFSGMGPALGSGVFNVSNNGDDINNSNITISQVSVLNLATATSEMMLNVSNSGVSETSGNANIAINQESQVEFTKGLLATSGLNMIISNEGTVNGGISVGGIGVVAGSQLHSEGLFNVSTDATFTISNLGTDDGSLGGNFIGVIILSQADFKLPFAAISGLDMTISNEGDSDNTGGASTNTGCIGNAQLNAENAFHAGSDATLVISNLGTHTNVGNNSFSGCSNNLQVVFSGEFTALSNLKMTISNEGTNDGIIDGNFIGLVGNSQCESFGLFNTGSNAEIIFSNSGAVNLGATIGTSPDNIGIVTNNQFENTQVFTATSDLQLTFLNEGYYGATVSVIDPSQVGFIGANQLHANVFYAGVDATITATNIGTNDVSSGADRDTIGVVNNSQLQVNNFFATSGLKMTAENTGVNAGAAGNNLIGLCSNYQLVSDKSFDAGSDAHIAITNIGTHSGSGSNNHVAVTSDYQTFFNGTFTAGSDLNLLVSNEGIDDGTGDLNQIGMAIFQFFSNGLFNVGDEAVIAFSNAGTNNLSGTNGKIGYISDSQAYFGNNFIAGDDLIMTVSNCGTNNGTSVNTVDGPQGIGYIPENQLEALALFSVGDNAQIQVTNSGINTSAISNQNIGHVHNDSQAAFQNVCAGDKFNLQIINEGTDSGSGDYNAIGLSDGSQLYCASGNFFSVGNEAKIQLTNTGTKSGSSTRSYVGSMGNQILMLENFTAESNFHLCISNQGINSNDGDNNFIGILSGLGQFIAFSPITVGTNAIIEVENMGRNAGSGSNNEVGHVFSQVDFRSGFTAGDCFQMFVTNEEDNTGTGSSNLVGFVGADQVKVQTVPFIVEDQAKINVINKGTVVGGQFNCFSDFYSGDHLFLSALNQEENNVGTSQIHFGAGFTTGKCASMYATNFGMIDSFSTGGDGILFDGTTSGGDVLINLYNSNLRIHTSGGSIPFYVSGLNGNIGSNVISNQAIVIDSGNCVVDAVFNGAISETSSGITVTKQGAGLQVFTGGNTYTGDTNIKGGILEIDGSILGDANVNNEGTLTGFGTIFGSILNDGLVAPSTTEIGMMTVGGDYIQSADGAYFVAVNGAGDSTLLNVLEGAVLDGVLIVGSTDGTYAINHPYPFLEALSGITGQFTLPIVVNPLLKANVFTDGPGTDVLFLQTNFLPFARTANEAHVATQFDELDIPNASTAALIDGLVTLTPEKFPAALKRLDGNQYAYIIEENQYSDRRFGRRIFDALRRELDPCREKLSDCEVSAWADLELGRRLSSKGPNGVGLQGNSIDISGGVHAPICQDVNLGVAGNLGTTRLGFGEGGHSSLQNGQAAIYVSYNHSDYYLFSDCILGGSWGRFKRLVDFGNFHEGASSHPNTLHGIWYGEAGLNFSMCDLGVKPFFGFDVDYVHQYGTRESSGAATNLNLYQRSTVNYHTYLGSHFSLQLTNEWTDCMTVNADLAWQYRFGRQGAVKVGFVEFGNSFVIQNDDSGRNGLWGNVNIETVMTDSIDLYLDFSGEYWNRWSAYSAAAGINYRW